MPDYDPIYFSIFAIKDEISQKGYMFGYIGGKNLQMKFQKNDTNFTLRNPLPNLLRNPLRNWVRQNSFLCYQVVKQLISLCELQVTDRSFFACK